MLTSAKNIFKNLKKSIMGDSGKANRCPNEIICDSGEYVECRWDEYLPCKFQVAG